MNRALGQELDRFPGDPADIEERQRSLRRAAVATDVFVAVTLTGAAALVVALVRGAWGPETPLEAHSGRVHVRF